MKKKTLLRLFLFTIMVGALSFTLKPQMAQAKIAEKNTTIKVDLTGDDKKETLRFRPMKGEYDDYEKLYIYVNGKKVKTITETFTSYEYRFVKLSNGKKFLYLHTCGPNDDGVDSLYQYKNRKLNRAINFHNILTCRWVRDIRVKGNTLSVTMCDNGAGIGLFSFTSIYTYKDHAFHLKSNTHTVLGYSIFDSSKEQSKDNGVIPLTVSKKFKIYSDKNCKKEIGTVPVGAVVKLTKVYCHGKHESGYSTYYITGENYSGWYSSKDYPYAMLFEGASGVA